MKTQNERIIDKKLLHRGAKIYNQIQVKHQEEKKNKENNIENNKKACVFDIYENHNKKEKFIEIFHPKDETINEKKRGKEFVGNKLEMVNNNSNQNKSNDSKMKKPAFLKKKRINTPNSDNSGNKNENFNNEISGTIFIKSHDNKIDKSDIIEILRKYGNISKIEMKEPYIYFIEFKNRISPYKAMKNKNKFFYKGEKLKVEYSKRQTKYKNISIMNEKTKEDIEILNEDDNKEKVIDIIAIKDDEEDKLTYLEKKIKDLEQEFKEIKEERKKNERRI